MAARRTTAADENTPPPHQRSRSRLAQDRRPGGHRDAGGLRVRRPGDRPAADRAVRRVRVAGHPGLRLVQRVRPQPASGLPVARGQRRGPDRGGNRVLRQCLARRRGHARGRVPDPVLRGDQRLLRGRGDRRGPGLRAVRDRARADVGDRLAAGRLGPGLGRRHPGRDADLAAAGTRVAAGGRGPGLPGPGRAGRFRLRWPARRGCRPERGAGVDHRAARPADRHAAPADRADPSHRRPGRAHRRAGLAVPVAGDPGPHPGRGAVRSREHRRDPRGRRGAAGLRRRTGGPAGAVGPRRGREAAGRAAGAGPGDRGPAAGRAGRGTAAPPRRRGTAGPGGPRVPGPHDLLHRAADRRVCARGQPAPGRAAHRGGARTRRPGGRRPVGPAGRRPRPADRRGPRLAPLDRLDAGLADRRGNRDPRGLPLGLVPQQRPRRGGPGHRGVHRPEIRSPALVLGGAGHPVGAALQRAGHRPVGDQRAGRHGRRASSSGRRSSSR